MVDGIAKKKAAKRPASAPAAEPSASPPKKKKLAKKSVAPEEPPKKRKTLDLLADDDAPKKKTKAKAEPKVDLVALAASSSVAISGNLDVDLLGRAVRALLTHIAREGGLGAGLLDDPSPIHVLLATKHHPKPLGKAKTDKPVPLQLPHPFVDIETADICLITKDPHKEYKDKLAAEGLQAKVLGVHSLKTKYHEYQAKRELLKAHAIFLADARILPMLPTLLGKTFYQKRRTPVAVDLKKKDLRAELSRAACGAHFRHAPNGTCNSVQLGTTAQPPAHLVENILCGIEQVGARIKGGWGEIQSLQLRTTNSIPLPFYNRV